MTNKEAIEILNKIIFTADFTDEYGDMINTEPYEEAINLAIKALKNKDDIGNVYHEAYCEGYDKGYRDGRIKSEADNV